MAKSRKTGQFAAQELPQLPSRPALPRVTHPRARLTVQSRVPPLWQDLATFLTYRHPPADTYGSLSHLQAVSCPPCPPTCLALRSSPKLPSSF